MTKKRRRRRRKKLSARQIAARARCRDLLRYASHAPIIAANAELTPSHMVYIQLRQKLPGQNTSNCPGLSIRAFDFPPQEVYRIIVAALTAEAEARQRLEKARQALES